MRSVSPSTLYAIKFEQEIFCDGTLTLCLEIEIERTVFHTAQSMHFCGTMRHLENMCV